jgi:hypothetical protein
MAFLLFYGFFLNVQLYSIRLRRLSAKENWAAAAWPENPPLFPLTLPAERDK